MKSEILAKFEKLAILFLEFEDECNTMSQEGRTSFTIDLQKEELKTLWEKVKLAYETFATSVITSSEEDCEEAKRMFRECKLAYITIAAQMGELSASCVNRSTLSSTQCGSQPNSTSGAGLNRSTSHHMRLPPCTMEVFKGDYGSWPSFRDLFTAVYINCEDLSED